MLAQSSIGRLSWAILTLSWAAACLADDKADEGNQAPPAVAKAAGSSRAALASLQRAHKEDGTTFIDEGDLDPLIPKSGGGACASAAGIDTMQTLRVMAGLDKLSNPHRAILAAFANQPDLLKGRVTNDQFVRLIEFYQSYLDGNKLIVEVESSPNSTYAADRRGWTTPDGPDLTPSPWQLRVLSFTETKPTREVVGRHFVLLKEHTKNHIVVVDPHGPSGERRYILNYISSDKAGSPRVFLLNPPDKPRRDPLDYELNTVFAVSISIDAVLDGQRPGVATSVADIKDKIDRTAAKLRGTADYINPRAWRSKTAAFGLPGLDLPIEYGGSNWPATKMIEVFRHAGRHNLNFRDVVGGAHVRPLLNSKNPEGPEIIRQVATGKAYIAIAITEPEAGSDVPAIKSTARKVEGGYRISGTKRFNARLDQATHIILFTQGTTGELGKLSVFVLPIDTPGLKIERLSAHGLAGNSYGGLSFQDVFVPEGRLIGKDGEGLTVFFKHFLYWRLMQAAAAIGTGEDALDQMAERIKTREAFGGPIGRFTHLQQPIGQHKIELLMAYALAREAAALIDDDKYYEARPLINGLKAEGVEIALKAVDSATRAFGGMGYSSLVDLGDRLMDLNGLRIADGTTDVMRMDVVRQLYGEDFWKMAVQDTEQDR
jgi:alkylation response protein AidB-like acyl-CoA dehydrogenase